MTTPDKPEYTHGSTGTKPSSPIDYANGDPVEAENFDYFLYTPINRIKAIIDFLDSMDTDGDAQVDAADYADNSGLLNNNTTADVRAHSHSTLTDITSDQHHTKTNSLDELVDADTTALKLDVLSNFSSSASNRLLIATDNNGVYYDDGTSLQLVAEHPSNIGTTDLGFDPATQTDVNNRVSESGDTMTGDLNMEATVDTNNTNGRMVLPVGTDKYAE